jgi:hypothetical protein
MIRNFLSALLATVLVTQPVLARAAEQEDGGAIRTEPAASDSADWVPEEQLLSAVDEPSPDPFASQEPFDGVEAASDDDDFADEAFWADGEAKPEFIPYQPQDELERGLWMQMDESERDLKVSATVIKDEALNDYVRDVLCKVAPDSGCQNVRIYVVRTPYFNASMAPNGVMQVWSGLLLRMENEAQLAAVLGHEYAHFQNRHSLQLFRQAKEKSNTASWLAFTGIGLLFSFGLIGSFFKFSRDMESEADALGLEYMARAGYDTREAAIVWERLRAEMDATADERQTKSRKDKNGGMFATHPPTKERVEELIAAAQANPGVPGATGRERFRAELDHVWQQFFDDQLKMNDFGASDFLITNLGTHGWSSGLLFARGELYRREGEPERLQQAVDFYSEAIVQGDCPPESWRGRGLALIKLGRAEEGRSDLREYLQQAPDAGDYAMINMLAGAN